MIKLVLSDLDGTLVPLAAGHPSQRTMRAIERVQAAGVRFGLATGRDIAELTQIFGGNDIAYRTGILSNGKKVFVDGELRHLTLLDNAALQRMAEALAHVPHTLVTAYPYHSSPSNPVYCMNMAEEELGLWSQRYAFEAIPVERVPDEEIIAATIACAGDERELAELWEVASAACPEFDLVRPAANWWDILPKGLNKGTALTLLLRELGIGLNEVVMFGDANNDLAILTAVEHAVVVAGATPDASAAARWHIGACEDDAVADALEQIAEAALTGDLPAFMEG